MIAKTNNFRSDINKNAKTGYGNPREEILVEQYLLHLETGNSDNKYF